MKKIKLNEQGGGHSNTPPANYKSKKFDEIVSHGIDTLKIGFVASMKKEFMEFLDHKKEVAQDPESEEDPILRINNYDFIVKSHGSRNYRYIIKNDLMNISIIDRVKNDSYPNVMIIISSQFLWSQGVERAYNKVRNTLVDITTSIVSEKVSRVDMCVDIAGNNIEQTLTDRNIVDDFVTRATGIQFFEQHRKNTGYVVGSDNSKIKLRIYDKAREIEQSNKYWFYNIWEIDKNSDIPVWRIEFQLNRKFFSNYMLPDPKTGELHTVETFNDLMNVLYDLWDYLVNDWFSIRKQDDSNTSRRTIYPLWQLVQSMDSFLAQSEKVGAVRKTIRRVTSEQLIMNVQGYFTSIMAVEGIKDLKLGLKYIMHTTWEILKDRFEDDLLRKMPKYQITQVA